jgi:ribose transport system permease protein
MGNYSGEINIKDKKINVKKESWISKKAEFSRIVPYLGLIFIVVLFTLLSGGNLLSAKNLMLMFRQSLILFMASLAGVFVMSTGNLDCAMGANIGFSCICACIAAQINPYLAIPVALLVGTGIGLFNGAVQVIFKLPSFITCICLLFALTAASQSLMPGTSISMPASMMSWDRDITNFIVVAIYFVILMVVFNYTKTGKYLKALGVSKEAARQSGVDVNKMKIIAFAISGFAAGLTGFFTMLRIGGATTTTGQTVTFNVIVAIVFGGMSVSGGASSKIRAAVLGTLIIAVLNNGMVISGIGGATQQLIKGLLFLLVIAFSIRRDKSVIDKNVI